MEKLNGPLKFDGNKFVEITPEEALERMMLSANDLVIGALYEFGSICREALETFELNGVDVESSLLS